MFSVGGYVLISALFQSTYERELANAAEENQICQYSFVAYWNLNVQEWMLNEENVRETAQAMTNGSMGSNLRIRLSDQNGEVWFDNTQAKPDEGLLTSIGEEKRGYMLRKTEKGFELQTASRIQLENGEFLYLENIRDVTELFAEREEQYRIYRWWMAGLLAAEGLGCSLMAVWLLRPLRRLSRATR